MYLVIVNVIVLSERSDMSKIGIVVLFVLAGILIPAYMLIRTKLVRNGSILKKEYSGSLKGLFAVYIALHHLALLSEPSSAILLPLKNVGYLCVSFFFLMSGYGLAMGYSRNGLKDFIKKRIIKIYIPYFLSIVVIGFLYLAFMDGVKVSDIFIKALLMKTIDSDGILWYVFVQIIMYVFFWVSFKFVPARNNNIFKLMTLFILTCLYILYCKVTAANLWRYNTVLCFPLGVCISLYKEKVIELISCHYKKILASMVCLFLFGFILVMLNKHSFVMSVLSSLMFACLTVLISFLTEIHSKLLLFLGNISYEYYIFQLPIIRIVMKNIKTDYFYSIIIVLATTVMAFFVHSISEKISRVLLKER